jgi:putative transposase
MKAGYKFEILPDEDQKVLLAKTFGCCRFVYNHILGQIKDVYSKGIKEPVGQNDLVNRLPSLKTQYEWLSEPSSIALQQSVRYLGDAFTNFFNKKAKYPTFKSKSNRQTFRITGENSIRIVDGYLDLPKIGLVKVLWSRKLPSTPSSYTITKTPSNRYYVSFVCERNKPKTTGTKEIGIDLNVNDIVLSDGIKINLPQSFNDHFNRLKKLQQWFSKTLKGSKRHERVRIYIAKLYQRITNVTNDFLHKLSTALVNDNQVICVEILEIMDMIKGSPASILTRKIQQARWRRFISMLAYKCQESKNCKLVLVDQVLHPSTQTCHICGYRHTGKYKIRLGVRAWTCPICLAYHDRDVNAAKNILKDGKHILFLHPEATYAQVILG